MARRGVARCAPERSEAAKSTLAGLIGATRATWRFRSNGQYFGVTQFLGAFNAAELDALGRTSTPALAAEIRARDNAVAAGREPATARRTRELHASMSLLAKPTFEVKGQFEGHRITRWTITVGSSSSQSVAYARVAEARTSLADAVAP